MPAKPPLTIGFNVPFHEAIAAAQLRGVVLPDVYYGELQGIARQLAFSIAGIASLDQLQAVKDSLSDYMAKGGSFKSWKRQSAQLNLELPSHRLENIWRTNLQGNYMRGKWEQFQRNADTRPYLLYDAINDSRVRPSHLAHDGTIRRVNDAFWKTHSPPLGYRCRCSLISLTEEQAQARSRPNSDGEGTGLYKTPQLEGGIPAEPDKGWDYNPFEDRMQWVNQALERFDPKLRAVGEKIATDARALITDNAPMQLREIKDFLEGHGATPIKIAIAPQDIVDTFNAARSGVYLSRYTANKQRKHPEITPESYLWLQELLDYGRRIYDRKNHVTVIQHRDQPYLAVLKVTKDLEWIFLQSFRRTDAKDIASIEKKIGGG